MSERTYIAGDPEAMRACDERQKRLGLNLSEILASMKEVIVQLALQARAMQTSEDSVTALHKRVVRRVDSAAVRDGGCLRPIVVSLYPSGIIGLRPERTWREELIPVAAVWDIALKRRVAVERREKAAAKAARKRRAK